MQSHDHLVHVDEAKRELIIYRVDKSGKKLLYTSITLPPVSAEKERLDAFAQQLGENLLLDSPAGRKLFGL